MINDTEVIIIMLVTVTNDPHLVNPYQPWYLIGINLHFQPGPHAHS